MTLPVSLQNLAARLAERTDWTIAEMRRLVLDAGVTQDELMPWARFDHPATDSYGRILVHHGGHFEIMVMSWAPGDCSAIHDHGHTQYGCVQIFGPAEHAVFRVEDGVISTLSRNQVTPGQVVGVSHTLVHQMCNPGAERFLSMHVYGTPEGKGNITGDARIYDVDAERVLRVDGGVFFALPEKEVKWEEPGPKPDFPTRLRHVVETLRRLQKMEEAGLPDTSSKNIQTVRADLFDPNHRERLLTCLAANTEPSGHQSNSVYWRALNWELREAAKAQAENPTQTDPFFQYAELYDAVIGQPCLDDFMAAYLDHFEKWSGRSLARSSWLSVGCGTGLTEAYLIQQKGVDPQKLLGIDVSEAMIAMAKQRITARQADLFDLTPGNTGLWDVVFSGLNVYHYLDHHRLEEAIAITASLVRPGGYFVGDFITPDHIRWYPNVLYAAEKDIVSLRTPRLVEAEGHIFQESEIVNVNFRHQRMHITYAGKHRRFLPPMHRVRQYFERHFQGPVELWDAHSRQIIGPDADSCPSTRYVVVAQRASSTLSQGDSIDQPAS